MVNRKGNKLEVLDDFIVDKSLPKHKSDSNKNTNVNNSFGDSETWGSSINVSSIGGSYDYSNDVDYAWMYIYERKRDEYNRNPTFRNRLSLRICVYLKRLNRIMLNLTLKRDSKKSIIYQNTEEFFKQLKKSFEFLENKDVNDIIEFYSKHIKQAKDLRQTALLENLINKIDIIKLESILFNDGHFTKYVSEEDIIKFNGKFGVKNLYLTRVKNFNRVIPNRIFELKQKADELLVFDNYVILHTDATGDVINETEAERKARIRREKDPILFGLIKGSTKLYYIGDWVDEYCDLTLDKLLNALEVEEANLINKESIQNYIIDNGK